MLREVSVRIFVVIKGENRYTFPVMDQAGKIIPDVMDLIRRRTRTNYNRLSRIYDLLSGAGEVTFTRAGLALLDVQPGEQVLEVGCGTGRALVDLAGAAGTGGRVCGIDLSDGMLKVTSSRLNAARLVEHVFLACGDAASLPYKNGSFNAVLISFTLELFSEEEIPIILGECRRVLVSAGRLCVVSMVKSDQPGLASQVYGWAHRHFPALIDCRPIAVRDSLVKASIHVRTSRQEQMWGLPVEIILGVND
jgi:ubiquinone/menaquinone biosynthesis C-methylase UbiE